MHSESEKDSDARAFQLIIAIEIAKMQMALARVGRGEVNDKYLGKPIFNEAVQTS